MKKVLFSSICISLFSVILFSCSSENNKTENPFRTVQYYSMDTSLTMQCHTIVNGDTVSYSRKLTSEEINKVKAPETYAVGSVGYFTVDTTDDEIEAIAREVQIKELFLYNNIEKDGFTWTTFSKEGEGDTLWNGYYGEREKDSLCFFYKKNTLNGFGYAYVTHKRVLEIIHTHIPNSDEVTLYEETYQYLKENHQVNYLTYYKLDPIAKGGKPVYLTIAYRDIEPGKPVLF